MTQFTTSPTKLARIAQSKPTGDYAQIANNGIALLKAGFYPAAETYLTRALELNPNLIELYCDLALAYNFNNKPYHALAVGFEALKTLPDQFINFSWIFQQIPIARHNPLYREILEYLQANNLYSDVLSGTFYRILTQDPRYVDLTDSDPKIALSCIDDVMCHVLCQAPVTDPLLEKQLTDLRDYLAQNPATDPATDPYKNIRASLIAQGLINEYVWTTPTTLSTTPPQNDLDRFMYEDISLTSLDAANAVLSQIDFAPARQYIADHLNFRAQLPTLAASIPAFGTIDNETSQIVRAQYEDNPYPRWHSAARKQTGKSEHPMPTVQNILSNAQDLLIAGCGTGQQILFAHDSYAAPTITAIDLSRTSMAYAQYRLNDLKIPLPQMYHGDILELSSLNRHFDVIECSGVLHHMKDPLAGLDSLLSILKPGGYLHLGLYSALARTDIHKARKHIAEQHYSADIHGIRTCRDDIINGRHLRNTTLMNSRDFYTTSTCRDLIFHVQEHNYTIPELKKIIQDRNLEFIGFEIVNPALMANFYRINGAGADTLDLDNWEKLEQAHPQTFRAMYNFWVRKPVTH